MRQDAQRFLERWAEAPHGTSAAEVLRELEASPYMASNLMRRDADFRRQYRTIQEQHRRQREDHDRLSPVEVDRRLRIFLNELAAQVDRGERLNQRKAAEVARVPIGTVYARRNVRDQHRYDPEFDAAFQEAIGGKIADIEDFALSLASTPADKIAETGAVWKQLSGVSNTARLVSALFRDRRDVKVQGDVQVLHRTLTSELQAISGRFEKPPEKVIEAGSPPETDS